ncbi:MAG: DeoR/GlpR transcriptional regulator [Rhodobacteraceae bacterium]|nr:DeoR/GlpR transcriptional regulator [Paracoccaceae bacterium]
MTHSHRELELLDVLRRFGGSARNSELASTLDVSEETVRRTVKVLSKSGSVARVHGGAYLVGTQVDPSFFRRIAQNSEEKRLIAREAVCSISDGMTLFLDVGSTTAYVAEELRVRNNLTVATNSVGVARTLVGHNNNRVFLLGGEMQADEHGAFGHVTERQARRFAYDIAVLSADALNAKMGFLFLNAAEANLASVITENTNQTVVVMAHDKYKSTAPHCSFSPQQISQLFTDKMPEKILRDQLDRWGIEVRVANQRGRNASEN